MLWLKNNRYFVKIYPNIQFEEEKIKEDGG